MDIFARDFGTVADGKTLNTKALQNAIDEAAKCGGRVILESGVYKTGTIWLRDHVELHLERGAILLCSENPDDLPTLPDYKSASAIDMPLKSGKSLIIADGIEGAALTGGGTVDMSGDKYYEPKTGEFEGWSYKRKNDDMPRFALIILGARNFLLEGVTFLNIPSACWTLWVNGSDIVNIRFVKILAKLDVPHCDGIHINCSSDVTVSDCTVKTGDDCLIVRANASALPENKPCERVTVTNCSLTSYSGAIRVGWVRDGVIRNCSFSNLVMTDTTCGIDIFIPADYPECGDRGREDTLVENLSFTNIIMDEIYGKPVKIHVVESEDTHVEAVRNLTFSGIRATALEFPLVLGKSDHPVENVVFANCQFTKTKEEAFPKPLKFHGAAAWSAAKHTAGDMVTNAKNIVFDNTSFTKL